MYLKFKLKKKQHVEISTLETNFNFILKDSSEYESSNPIWFCFWLQPFPLVGVFVAYRHTLSDVSSCQIINSTAQRRGGTQKLTPIRHVN